MKNPQEVTGSAKKADGMNSVPSEKWERLSPLARQLVIELVDYLTCDPDAVGAEMTFSHIDDEGIRGKTLLSWEMGEAQTFFV